MKFAGILSVVATLALTASAAPSEIEDRASVSFSASAAQALKADTGSTISQLKSIQKKYNSDAQSAIHSWKGSAKTAINRDLSHFNQAIKAADQALDHINSVLARLPNDDDAGKKW